MGKGSARRSRRTTNASQVAAEAAWPATFVLPPLSRSARIALALVILATFAAFLPAIRAPFAFDDVGSITSNATIEHVFPLSTSLNPPPRLAVSGRPAVNVSLAIDHAVSAALEIGSTADSATVVYRVTNVLLHVLCGLLLFGVIRRTMWFGAMGSWANANAELVALVSSVLWLWHPIQSEAVDYAIQRTELLVSACYLATLYASIRAWDASILERRTAWLIAGLAACLVGMASKEVMVTAPFVVVAYDRVFRVSSWRALWYDRARRWFYAGLFSSLALLAVLVAGGGRADSVGFGLSLPWYRYFYSQGWAIAHYLQLLVWPADLRFDYGAAPLRGIGPLVGGLIVLAAAGGAVAVAIKRKQWWLAFLVVWFLAILAPSSSIVPIQTEIAAERRVYLASAAIVVAVVVAAAHLLRSRPRLFVGASGVVAALLLALTARRSTLYANPEALWRDALAKQPGNPRAYDNLAAVIYKKDRGRAAEAESLWSRAVALDSTYMPPWSNLAQVRVDEGRPTDARALLEHALRINPDYVDATRRIGGLLASRGDTKSIAYLERMASSPDTTDELFVALGQAYVDANRLDDAASALKRALAVNPRRADAAALLGGLLAEQGTMADALPYLASAVANGDRNPVTFALLSLGYAQRHRVEESVKAASQAAALGGSNAQVDLMIGRAMVEVGRLDEAETFLTSATRAAPNDPEGITRLGLLRAARGDMRAAIELFRRALSVSPGYPPALQALAKAGAK
jgi:tetratricopeptide (TPR) repeat protein